MIKNISEIETALGLKAGTLDTAIKSTTEDVIDISGLEIMKKTDFESFKTNLKENSRTAAIEESVKEYRTKLGLDFQGKTLDKLVDAYKEKIIKDANLNPDKRVSELEKDLGIMKNNYETTNEKLTKVESEYKQKENLRTIRDAVVAEIPANTIIPKEDVLNIFFSKNKIELVDTGGIIFKKGDEVLKNPTTLNPLSIKEVMTEFITPYVKPPEGGGGGKDNPGLAKPGSFAAFSEEMVKAGNPEGSTKFNEEMSKRIKEKTLVM